MAITNKTSISSAEIETWRRQQEMLDKMGMIGGAPSTMGIGALYPPSAGPLFAPEHITSPHTMLYHASVEKAENGFILKVVHKQGEQAKLYVATDADDLQRVFIAAIVGERITK